MKIAIYGASGMVGSRVATEALNRGHSVTGVTRTGGAVPAGVTAVTGDAGDAAVAKSVAADADVVVSAIGPSRTGEDHQLYLDALRNLADNAGDTRLLVIGGAGSLLVDGRRLVDSPGFPEMYKPESLTAAAALEYIRSLGTEVDWTFLSPAPVIEPGERTGSYRTGLDSPAGDTISAEDFAVALVDELERRDHPHRRFTVAN
jgi:putative NADH-flavin reductase